jgi:hypothetical protein
VSHLKVASTQTFSTDPISCQPLPEPGYTPVSSSHPVQWSKHNTPVPRNSVPKNSASAPPTWQPKSHSCLSYILPLAQLITSAESKPTCEHDPPLVLLQQLCSPFAMPTPEGSVLIPSEVAHIALPSDISESTPSGTCNPIWYDVSFHYVPFQASFLVNFERFTDRRLFLIFPQMSNSGNPPAKPGVYLSAITWNVCQNELRSIISQ